MNSKAAKRGQMLLFFTDGLYEVEDASGTHFTEDQLHTTVTRSGAFQPRNFLTASSATFTSFRKANRLTTIFALWEWKCSTPVELLAEAGVRGGSTAEPVLARAAASSSLGAVTTQNVLLVTGEND